MLSVAVIRHSFIFWQLDCIGKMSQKRNSLVLTVELKLQLAISRILFYGSKKKLFDLFPDMSTTTRRKRSTVESLSLTLINMTEIKIVSQCTFFFRNIKKKKEFAACDLIFRMANMFLNQNTI